MRYVFSFSRALAKPHDQCVGKLKSLELLIVNHYPSKFGSYGHCSREDVMALVVEGHHSTCSHFNPPLLFIYKARNMKAHDIKIISPILVTRFVGNKLWKNSKKTFASPLLKHCSEWEKQLQERPLLQSSCVARQHRNNNKKLKFFWCKLTNCDSSVNNSFLFSTDTSFETN